MALLVASAVSAALVLFLVRRGESVPHAPVSDVPTVEGSTIVVSEAFLAASGVELAAASTGPLSPRIEAVGRLEFAPTRVAAVGPKAPGIVRRVLHVEGDAVEKDDVLAEIEAPGLTDAQADLRVARAKRRAASANAERESELLDRQLTTAREEELARAALEQQDALASAAARRVTALGGTQVMGLSVLRAPMAGIVAERAIAPGQSVGPGLIAFRVGDLDELWVVLRVFERHIGLVRDGDPVEIRPAADAKRVLHGKVAHVGAVLDDETRSAEIRIELSNEDHRLRPGQAVRASIVASGPARTTLSVPSTAITYVDGAPTVFVAEAPSRFTARKVDLGLDGGERVEISKGVREGEKVVVHGVLALKSELYR